MHMASVTQTSSWQRVTGILLSDDTQTPPLRFSPSVLALRWLSP